MRIFSALLTLLLVIAGAIFAALNAKPVSVHYLFGVGDVPLAVVLLIAMTLGILLGIVVLGYGLLKLTAKNKWLASKLRKTQDQLAQFQH